MPKLAFKTLVKAQIEEVFELISDPTNLRILYPRELAVKVRINPEKHEKEPEYSVETKLLNQRFVWDCIVEEMEKPNSFAVRALRSPFKKWIHKYSLTQRNEGTEVSDEIEFDAPLGLIGNAITNKFLNSVIDYRNSMLRRVFGSNEEPRFKDPSYIPLNTGTAISFILVVLSLIIAFLTPSSFILSLLLGLLSLALGWFFSHDLLHYLVGRALGIRFSNYFLGLSNIVRLGIVKGDAMFLLVALGLRIDRSIKYSGKKLAAMYLSGPLASMVFPALLSLIVLRNNYDAGLVLLLISAVNIAFTSYFSPRQGCIAKATNRIRKQT